MRIAFRLRISQDIFQRKTDQIYENCRGAVGIADDVQVFGNEKTLTEICMKQWSALEKLGNFDKCIIKNKCFSFLVSCTPQKESSLIQ